ncbi:hypothetical protein OCL06_14890 [Alteromonas sp. ASW11-19]|uniref:Uncharacterized protein n=1 Tax=Alteromonas salexigens TaxID=2982530 RepID=A0ABT2VRD6_9ALTE|nr:hypothetical protein [Alteromonas salexigens]MCU7555875.1 hypothetical protein [Alteromonas salexigens]
MDLQAAHLILNQLATICTYLGGFSLVFLGALITMRGTESRAAQVTIVSSAVASCCFILSAVGWGILQLSAALPANDVPVDKMLDALFGTRHKLFSLLYLAGQFSLFVCIGSSGYLHSRKIGHLTFGIGAFGFAIMGYVLSPYVNFG